MSGSVQIVIGFGEVGQAIGSLLNEAGHFVYTLDPFINHENLPEGDEPIKAIHICFPYSGSFESSVRTYRNIFRPEMVIVHSTVKPGTCDANDWVHSPVQGKHPGMAENIKRFIKWFGGKQCVEASELFPQLKSELFDKAIVCELAKVLDTTRYGWEIVWAREAQLLAEQFGVSTYIVNDLWTIDYNAGYRDTRYPRSLLIPKTGPIGGHCVIPNLKLLDDWWVADLISALNDVRYKEEA